MSESSDASRPKLHRRRHPKVRSGCIVCKKRRIKCDETKPKCRRCSKAGWDCEGYSLPRTWLFQPGQDAAEEPPSHQYYQEKTVGAVSGYFDQPFWEELVLTLSHSEPAIKHAVVAFASLHETISDAFTNSSFGLSTYMKKRNFALKHCNTAIQLLMSMPDQSNNAILTACSLFICFEAFQNHYGRAMGYFFGGMNVLRSAQQQPLPEDIDNRIVRFFQSIYQENSGLVAPVDTFDDEVQGQTAPVAAISDFFRSVEEAEIVLHRLIRRIIRAVFSTRFLDDRFGVIGGDLARWNGAIDHLYTNNWSDVNSHRSLALLRVKYIVARILLHTVQASDEMVYDEHISNFEQIVDLCWRVHNMVGAGDPFSRPDVKWTDNRQAQAPLYFVAASCRDPTIRRSAISLLDQYIINLTEGERNETKSMHTSPRMVERIMMIEENACPNLVTRATDIPEACRVRISKATDFTGDCRVLLRYSRYPYDENSPLGEEVITLSGVDVPMPNIDSTTIDSETMEMDHNFRQGVLSPIAAQSRLNRNVLLGTCKHSMLFPCSTSAEPTPGGEFLPMVGDDWPYTTGRSPELPGSTKADVAADYTFTTEFQQAALPDHSAGVPSSSRSSSLSSNAPSSSATPNSPTISQEEQDQLKEYIRASDNGPGGLVPVDPRLRSKMPRETLDAADAIPPSYATGPTSHSMAYPTAENPLDFDFLSTPSKVGLSLPFPFG